MVNRRSVLASTLATAALASVPFAAQAQSKKDTIVMAMALEPSPGLDPTGGAAAAISEISLYNIFETLVKINSDGSITPLLAESWEVSPDLKSYTFKLRKDAKFQNGVPFNGNIVKFSFERGAAENSVNPNKRLYQKFDRVAVIDDYTVVILNKEINPELLFMLGQGTSIMVEPSSVETNGTKPVGTGPFKVDVWNLSLIHISEPTRPY